jgi:hypothetical protein
MTVLRVEVGSSLNLQTEYDLRMMKRKSWADIEPRRSTQLPCRSGMRADATQLISFGLLDLEQIPS